MDHSDRQSFLTPSGIVVERTRERADDAALAALRKRLDHRRGALLCSTYEYPGRYVKRELGFVDPPLVLESQGRSLLLTALNERGVILLEPLARVLDRERHLFARARSDTQLRYEVAPVGELASEEQRTRQPSVFSALRALLRALSLPSEPLFGLYGAFGYDLVLQLESLLCKQPRDDQRELVLYLPDELLVREGERGPVERHRYEFSFAGAHTQGVARTGQLAPFVPDDSLAAACDHRAGQFEAVVERAREAFRRGDLFEVTPSQTFVRPFYGSPARLFERLRTSNPAPYGFLLNLGHGEFLVGASPEMYVRVRGARVETCPIAGTIARGADALEDERQIRALLTSEKEEAELTMCTDVDRNDKARICKAGSVRVIGRRQIELYSRLIHTVDHVLGELREGYDALDALLTHMWAVTVTGAPKIDAIQFIEDHEQSPRRFYAGAVGCLSFDGGIDTGLTLRTVHLRAGRAEVRAGATLLFDSDPDEEQRECELKASALLRLLDAPAAASAPKVRALRDQRLRVLLIDHRDSFVHTLADYFRQAGCEVTTLRHGFAATHYERLDPQLVVLSPGPKRPCDFELNEVLAELARRALPVFGVCLGLQAMVEYAGGTLRELPRPVHGKPSTLHVDRADHALLRGLPAQLRVGRYHSLCAGQHELPEQLHSLAHSEDGCTMALAHHTLPWHAVQFHPESILSAHGGHGLRLIENVSELARRSSGKARAQAHDGLQTCT